MPASIKSRLSLDNLIAYLIYSSVIIIPLYYNTAAASVFIAPKLFVLRIITLLILTLVSVKIFQEGKIGLRKSAPLKYLLIYGFISFLTVIFSVHPFSSIFGNQGRFLGIITYFNFFLISFFALNFLKNKKTIIYLMLISSFIAFATAVWGLLQSRGIGIIHEWNMDPTLRVFVTFGHSNHFGAYLAFHALLILGLIFYFKKLWQKIILSGLAITIFIGIFPTASRGALLAFSLSFLIFFIYYLKIKKFNFHKKKSKILLVSLAVIASLSIIAFVVFRQPIVNKSKSMKAVQRTMANIEFIRQGNIPDRFSWWLSAFSMIKDHPFFGTGISTFKETYDLYRRQDYRIPGDEQDYINPETAHLEYINIAANQGLIGLISYLFFIGVFLISMRKYILQNSENQFLGLGIFTAILTYLLQVLFSFGEISTLIFLYLFIGAGCALMNLEKPEIVTLYPVKYKKSISIILFIFILTGIYYSFRFYQAEKKYYLGKVAEKAELYSQAVEFYDQAISFSPYEYEYWSGMADSASAGAEKGINQKMLDQDDINNIKTFLDISIKASLRAINIVDDYPKLHGNLALTYFLSKEFFTLIGEEQNVKSFYEKAIEEYKKAVEFSPNNPMYPYNLGKTFLMDKNCSAAVPYFKEALARREPYKDTYQILADCYNQLGDKEKEGYYRNKL